MYRRATNGTTYATLLTSGRFARARRAAHGVQVSAATSQPHLLGRAAEIAALQRLIAGRGDGGGVTLIRGEPGIGKTVLLDEARRLAAAGGMQVLSATGVQSESLMPFAALHQLIRPLLDRTAALPETQRVALSAAFGAVDGEAPELFRIALAVLALLSESASEQALFLAADDLQWFDLASANVLLFVARRVALDHIVFVGAIRDGWDDVFEDSRFPEILLGRLSSDDSLALLARHAPRVGARTRERLLAAASGNPLALIELPLSIQIANESTLFPETVPLSSRLERAFTGRLRKLPASTRSLLLAAALHAGGSLGEVLAAARFIDPAVTLADLDAAEDARIVEVTELHVSFRHPLLLAAVHQDASTVQRLEMHRALASSVTSNAEQRIWHRAACAVGKDQQLADDLESLARRCVGRGALAAAAAAAQRAGELAVEEPDRGRLLLLAASHALSTGKLDVVGDLLCETASIALRPADARLRLLLVSAAHPPSPGDEAGVLALADAADSVLDEGDIEVALELLLVAVGAELHANRENTSGARLLKTSRRVPDSDRDPRMLLIRAFASPISSGAEVLRTLASFGFDELRDHKHRGMIASAAISAGSFDIAIGHLDEAIAGLRRSGDLRQLTQLLVFRGWTSFYVGNWDVSLQDAGEAVLLCRETRQTTYEHALLNLQATVDSLRGNIKRANELMSDAERAGMSLGAPSLLQSVQFARGLLALSMCDFADAYFQLARTFDPVDPSYHRNHSWWTIGYLAEAAAQCDKMPEARAILRGVEEIGARTPASHIHVSLRHARAILADDEHAEPLFQQALIADLTAWPLDRARLNLAYGVWLRRRRRIANAREPLRRARDAFDAIGAISWAEQARQQLRAAGEVSRQRSARKGEQLTPQELQIALLAADGLSNREIGQRCFLSHRTVGSHLYRIFPKLGITSRSQLAAVLRPTGSASSHMTDARTSFSSQTRA